MILSPTLAAQNILEKFGIEDPATTDISDLITYYDGIVLEEPLGDCDGRTVMKNGKSIVSLNANIEFPQKKRFVLAHELGHMILHGDKEATFSDDHLTLEAYKHGPQETEANNFAAELLMPTNLFQQVCFKKKFSSNLLRSISDRFNTSITSVVYRFLEHGNHPICVFYSKNGKIQYWRKSKDFRYYVPELNKLNAPSDSVANEFYVHGRIYRKEDADQPITKSTWFELSEYDSDTKMYEFCIVTKQYNTVLSVVWEP